MPKIREFLSSREFLLLTDVNEFNNLTPQDRASLFRDVRLKARKMIDVLAFLALRLPEKQQAKVFTPSSIQVLVDPLLGVDLERREQRQDLLAQFLALKSLSILEERLVGQKFGTILSKDLERVRAIIQLILQPEKE